MKCSLAGPSLGNALACDRQLSPQIVVAAQLGLAMAPYLGRLRAAGVADAPASVIAVEAPIANRLAASRAEQLYNLQMELPAMTELTGPIVELPEGRRALETRYGSLSVPNLENDLIVRFLARFGEWAWLETVFVGALLRAGARVVDAGAFLGTFGIGLSKCQELEALCFIEANAEILPYLRANVGRCCGTQHTILPAMLCPKDSPSSPGAAQPGNLGSASYVARIGGARTRSLPAPKETVSLRELDEKFGPFDLIKLDLEGMELPLLTAEREFLLTSRSALWVECNQDMASLALADVLLGSGLSLWYFAFPAFNSENHAASSTPIFPFAYESALLASRTPFAVDPLSVLPPGCLLRSIHSNEDLKKAMWLTPHFAPATWEGLEREAIIALAMHIIMGETYDSYLSGAPRPTTPAAARLRKKLTDAQAEITRLQGLLHERSSAPNVSSGK